MAQTKSVRKKATAERKPSSGRKPSGKASSVRGKRADIPSQGFLEKNGDIVKEILIIAAIAFSFVMVLSVFTKNMGALGSFIYSLLFGMLGIGAYFIPFLLIVYLIAGLARGTYGEAYKIAAAVAAICSALSAAHIAGHDVDAVRKLGEFIRFYYDAGSAKNGGLLGAFVGNTLLKIVGYAGAYILIVAIIIIAAILVTGQSFFAQVSKAANAAGEVKRRAYRASESRVPKYRPTQKLQTEEMELVIYDGGRKKVFDFASGEDSKPKETEERSDSIQASRREVEAAEQTQREEVSADKQRAESDAVLDSMVFPTASAEPVQQIQINGITKDEVEDLFAQEGMRIKTEDEEDGHGISIPQPSEYVYPPINLLNPPPESNTKESKEQMLRNAKKLEETLMSFGVDAKVVQINRGPAVTRYELSPRQGVKVSKIVNLADDIALNLAAAGIRIEAPIPGKAAVGIEVPNKEQETVSLREVLEDEQFEKFSSKLAFGVGKDIAGMGVVTDIAKMPHLLIAGATGSGKSVCINTLITSILYKANPNEVKLLMIDPKVVELSIYNGIPHLLIPVVTDPKKAAGALHWAVQEMIKRYKLFADYNVRDMKGYNQAVMEAEDGELMPQIVIIIDELADLMMAAPGDVEDSICRLAQMARAAGLHLIIATQRPSVDVITGVIKANIPSRLAFAVSSGTDSRTILDMVGAEKLLGKGDMLFYPSGLPKPVRIQGAFVSDKEVESVVNFLKSQQPMEYDPKMVDTITAPGKNADSGENDDEFMEEAIAFIVQKEKASVSMLQRQFRIGYNRAARMMEELEGRGIVGAEDGSKPRKVLMTKREHEEWQQRRLDG